MATITLTANPLQPVQSESRKKLLQELKTLEAPKGPLSLTKPKAEKVKNEGKRRKLSGWLDGVRKVTRAQPSPLATVTDKEDIAAARASLNRSISESYSESSQSDSSTLYSTVTQASSPRTEHLAAAKQAESLDNNESKSTVTWTISQNNDPPESPDQYTDNHISYPMSPKRFEGLESIVTLESDGSLIVPTETKPSLLHIPVKNFYIGSQKWLPLPKHKRIEWNTYILERLINDLVQVLNKPTLNIADISFEAEYCYVGKAATDSKKAKTIRLVPTVWIGCGTKRCRDILRRNVKCLDYLQDFSEGRVEVHIGGPRPAAANSYRKRDELPPLTKGPEPTFTMPAMRVQDPGTGYKLYTTATYNSTSLSTTVATPTRTNIEVQNSDFHHKGDLTPAEIAGVSISIVSAILVVVLVWFLRRMCIRQYQLREVMNRYPKKNTPYLDVRYKLEEGILDMRTVNEISPPCYLHKELSSHNSISLYAGDKKPACPIWLSACTVKIERVDYGTSPCGLKVQIVKRTEGKKIENTSTLGGIIRVGNKVFATTTAHGLYLGDHHTSLDNLAALINSTQESIDCITVTEENISSISGAMASDTSPTSSRTPDFEVTWESANGISAFSYAPFEAVNGSESMDAPSGSDFMLVEMGRGDFHSNKYLHPDFADKEFSVSGILKDADISSGPVIILTGKSVRKGHLLDENTFIVQCGGIFRTRKIELSAPLPAGFSGSWVVRGTQLCGYIVASYDQLPYAHMITAEKMVSDISKVTGLTNIEFPCVEIMPQLPL